MLRLPAALAALCTIFLPSSLFLADTTEKRKVESGCRVGEAIPVFKVVDVTGPNRGKRLCYV